MKRISIIISTLLWAWVSVSAQYNEFSSNWSQQSKDIDGCQTDWLPSFQYKGVNASFAVSNDSEYFYLIFNTSNQAVQRKIMRSGMSVTVSGKGGKKNRVKVIFPLEQDGKNNINRARPEPGDNSELLNNRTLMQKKYIQSCNEMQVKGIESLSGTVPVENESGLLVGLNWNENNLLTYELQIPLIELIGDSDPGSLDTDEIKVIIFINALTQGGGQGAGMRSGGTSGRGSSMGGGGRSGGGSNMGGGRPGGGSNMDSGRPGGSPAQGNNNTMFYNEVYKSKITLSNPVR